MSHVANETFKNVLKILGYNIDESEKKSRKRPAEDTSHFPAKQRRFSGLSSKLIPSILLDKSHSYTLSSVDSRFKKSADFPPIQIPTRSFPLSLSLSAEKLFKSQHFNAALFGDTNYSKYKPMGSQYADIEYSDNEENDELITGVNKPKNVSTLNTAKAMNGHKEPERKSLYSSFKSSPPPMLPLRRGALMLNSIPGLNPISKSKTSFGSFMNNASSSQRFSSLTNGGFVKSDSFTFNAPTKKSTEIKQDNSIINSAFKFDERTKYFHLLKRCAPSVYQAPDSDKERIVLKTTPPKLRAPKILSEIIPVDDDDDDDIVEVPVSSIRTFFPGNNENITYDDDKPKFNVEPVNSLKNRFSLKPEFQDGWLENISQKYSNRKEQRKVDIKEQIESLESLTINTRQSELELKKKLQEFTINSDIIVVEDSESEEEIDEFPELQEDHRRYINNVTLGGPQNTIVIEKFNLQIKRMDLCTLLDGKWLNDEVINFYMNLLMERSSLRKEENYPSVYSMNTFFIPKLLSGGHSAVRRWTRKVDIFSYDVIPVPVHVGQVHWCMAIIHLKNKSIKYYDSMGSPNNYVLRALDSYLREESLDKRKSPFDTSDFTIENVKECPRQMNGSDCGVFSCMTAEYLTRNRNVTFSQENMPYFRNKMILEIATGKLLL